MKSHFILILIIILFVSCNIKNNCTSHVSAIDNALQVTVDSILRNSLSELNATSGQVIVMDVQSEAIKASAGTELKPQESGLTRTASLLAALESGIVKLADTVDVNDGILLVGNDTLLDHNWHRGGYGIISLKQGFAASSNIANYKTVQKIFKNGYTFAKAIAKYGYQVKDTSLMYNSIGYGIPVTPLQNLKFYNSIAQGTIASQAVTDSMRQALEYAVTNGLAKPAMSDKVKIAGATGTIQLPNGEYAVEFCGYFPADNPQYSVIVSINKKNKPASGGLMAGTVFKQIAEYLMTREEPADVESLEFWTADTILKANKKLVALMKPLYQYVHADSLSALTFEKDLKWMNEYREKLCNYYNANRLGTDTISPYAKADAVIEASRELWKLDSDDSTTGINVKNGIEYTRLIFEQFNEYAQLLDICKTEKQRKLLKNEMMAWYELEELLSKTYTDCIYLKYWGGSYASPASSAGMLKMWESHISLYRIDKSILKNDFEAWNTLGLYMECAKELPVNCFLVKLKESIYEENGEDYKKQLDTTRQDLSQLSSKINKWITAHQLWIKGIDKYGIEDISEKHVGNMLVELSSIISSI